RRGRTDGRRPDTPSVQAARASGLRQRTLTHLTLEEPHVFPEHESPQAPVPGRAPQPPGRHPGRAGRRPERCRILIPPLITQLLDLAGLKLLELSDRPGLVWKQIELGFAVPSNRDGALVNLIVDPVDRHAQLLGHLAHRQVPGDAARPRPTMPGQ